ncbi:fish-egg lectin-like [Morone saxatilis]|uniref:fish-egg lectin-like n=1 Tax=Morone saxatilis TaxID=34816 RepID=UPI0015E23D38|nr:fish-egg lectin-like [Morone saxatilis]
MKAVAAFLLVLCYLAASHAWSCNEAPRLYNAAQVDAGLGKVIARDTSGYAYLLIGTSWYRLTTSVRFKHVSVGPAGIWGADTSNRAQKFIAGQFRQSSGASVQQVDAGGAGQVVGVGTSYHAYCLRNTYALAFAGSGSLSWSYLGRTMRYYSCSPLKGCWGVDTSYRVYYTQTIVPSSCGTSGWYQISGLSLKVIEVGTDGTVFGLTTSGKVYQRAGITSSNPRGTSWSLVSMCMSVRHMSYDLRNLWVVTTSGLLMKCTH